MSDKPKGRLLIIGGAEDKGDDGRLEMAEKNEDFHRFEILKKLLPETKSKSNIEIITTATVIPKEVGNDYNLVFEKLGFSDVGIIYIDNREEANEKELLKRIKNAHAVFFTGGDQFRLSTILGGSKVIMEMKERYQSDPEFIVAGTSAGAMAMAATMITEGQGGEAMLKGQLHTSAGLGFVDYCIVDTHFVKRGRFARLAQAVISNPNCVGIGLGEDTALMINDGNYMECVGSGMVTIIDGFNLKHTNIFYADNSTPICAEGLTVHILCKGNSFLLKERRFIPRPEDLKQEKTH